MGLVDSFDYSSPRRHLRAAWFDRPESGSSGEAAPTGNVKAETAHVKAGGAAVGPGHLMMIGRARSIMGGVPFKAMAWPPL